MRGHPDERPLSNVNLNINVLVTTPNERPPLLDGHFSDAKGVASQKGFHCIGISSKQFKLQLLERTKTSHRLYEGSKTRLIISCTQRRENPTNLVTSRKINTRLACPISNGEDPNFNSSSISSTY